MANPRERELHDPFGESFAIGEAIAHPHRLWQGGKLRRELGRDGVLRFALT